MESFIFKGSNSNDLGIVIKEMPAVTKSEKNIDLLVQLLVEKKLLK